MGNSGGLLLPIATGTDVRRVADAPAPRELRTKLRKYEHVASQRLNSFVCSGIMICHLDKLWDVCKKGIKHVNSYSQFCDEDPLRRGVGISRFAEGMVQVCDKTMADQHVAAVVKEALLAAAREEATALKPHQTILNGGPRHIQKVPMQNLSPGISFHVIIISA